MTVTRKDLEAVAFELKLARPNPVAEDGFTAEQYPTRYEQWFVTVRHVSYALEASNERFDLDRFYKACGVHAAL